MFSFVIFGLLACVGVRVLTGLVLRRFARAPRWLVWLNGASWVGMWLFVLVGVFLISIIVAALIAVVAAACLLVLGLEARRRGRGMGRRNPRSSSSG